MGKAHRPTPEAMPPLLPLLLPSRAMLCKTTKPLDKPKQTHVFPFSALLLFCFTHTPTTPQCFAGRLTSRHRRARALALALVARVRSTNQLSAGLRVALIATVSFSFVFFHVFLIASTHTHTLSLPSSTHTLRPC